MQLRIISLWIGISLGLGISSSVSAEWKHNTEVFFAASDDASVSGLRWLQPWWQTGEALAFSDLRMLKSDKNTEEANLGGGYRKFISDETAIIGGYGFLDYRLSATSRSFTQITLGGEYLTDNWEFRANLYQPLKDEYIIGDAEAPDPLQNDSFVGNTLTRVSTIVPAGVIVEEALSGADLEVGYLLPGSEDFEIRANLALYQFSAPVAGSTQGIRARLEAFPRENFKVNVSVESDDLFETRSFLELSFPLGRKLGRPGKRSLHKRMTQFAYRDIDVRETSRLDVNKRTKNGPGTAEAIANTRQVTTLLEDGIIHVDKQTSHTNPDGSIERPYSSISQCGASCTSAKVVYLHANSGTRAADRSYIGNLSFNGTQKIVGDGATTGNFAGVASGTKPILLGATGNVNPVLTLTDDARANGIQVGWSYLPEGTETKPATIPTGAAMPNIGVLVNNPISVQLADIDVTGALNTNEDASATEDDINVTNNFMTGIHILADGSAPTTRSSSTNMNNVNVRGSLESGIRIEANSPAGTAGTPSVLTQSTVMRGITLHRNGRGIYGTVNGGEYSQVNQSIILESPNPSSTDIANNIDLHFNEGILVANLGFHSTTNPTFRADQDLTVKNTLIQSNQGSGIQALFGPIHTFANNNQRESTLTLDYVNINRNSGGGIVYESNSSNTAADIKNTSLIGNILNPKAVQFGNRLDNTGSPVINISDPNDINNEVFILRPSNYGLFARIKETAGAGSSTQNITISENFQVLLHGENEAQIYLEADSISNSSSSSQSITIVRNADEPKIIADPNTQITKLIADQTGEIDANGNLRLKEGVTTPRVAFCDFTSNVATKTDGLSPHISFQGLLADTNTNGTLVIPREERCRAP